jgi:hypothetical protein
MGEVVEEVQVRERNRWHDVCTMSEGNAVVDAGHEYVGESLHTDTKNAS